MPAGSYIFELDTDVEIKTIPFTIKSNSIVYDRDLAKTTYKPIARVKGDIVFVSKLALNHEPLKINIYKDSELLLSETVENTNKIERVYKLTGLNSGDYKIVFNTEGRTFTEFINN